MNSNTIGCFDVIFRLFNKIKTSFLTFKIKKFNIKFSIVTRIDCQIKCRIKFFKKAI